MKDVNVLIVIVSSILSAAFACGVFYGTVLLRVKKLEQNQTLNDEARNRLIRLETKIDMLLKNDK